MHALNGPNQPTPGEIEESLCASCLYGSCVVVRTRPDDTGDAPEQHWQTRSFCRNLKIAGSGGTAGFEEPVQACTEFERDPSQEPPA